MKTPIFDFSILEDSVFRTGLLMYVASTILFLSTYHLVGDAFTNELPIMFFIHYGTFIIYLFILMNDNKNHEDRYFRFRGLRKNILLLLLFNVSAYSLNRSLPVFQESTEWLQMLLTAMNAAMVVFCFRPRPLQFDIVNIAIVIVLGFSFVLQIYQSFYLIPFYFYMAFSFWLFGFSLHALVPIWLSVTLYKMIKQYTHDTPDYRWAVIGSTMLPIFILIGFGIKWKQVNDITFKNMPRYYDYEETKFNHETINDLPNWVFVSQQLSNDWITKRALKSRIVYTTLETSEYDAFPFSPSNSFGSRLQERQQHDPFVALSSLIFGEIELNYQQKFQLYQSVFNARHQTEERLWSGDHLQTNTIQTDVELFPEHRIAYTEKTFTIKNNYKGKGSWRGQTTQEALYSFYIPEGAVVTSASLWVNGVEEKSYLTTKSKADNAYKTIVGVERRDPLLLHWQEGNRISVRVFPCTPDEDRIFKIGVTSPLHFSDKKLTYSNIDFEGPFWALAKEKINIFYKGKDIELNSSLRLKSSDNGWKYEGRYKSNWTLKMNAPPLAYSTFSFNDRSFRVQDLLPLTEDFSPSEIYLDINSSWTKRQCNKIWKKIKDKNVYVFDKTITKVTSSNHKELFAKLRQQRFTLFPFYKIENVEQAIVITQGNRYTPTLADISNSTFANHLNDFLQKNNTPIRVFNFDEETTPYLKTLNELKVFNFQKGDVNQFLHQFTNKRFPKHQGSSSIVSIPTSDIQIESIPNEQVLNNAPDHLLRLFAYNDVMKKIGKNYFNQTHITDELIGQAQEAYVVTPISSMIVLESKADYERFDIEEVEGSLKNASIQNSGSVPEPHEWFLIILCFFTMIYLKFKLSTNN